jgi:hypothetical protein
MLFGVGNSGSPEYRARQRERERRRRSQPKPAVTAGDATAASKDVTATGPVRRAAATVCGWCGSSITPRSRGPIPKWCSANCRHRAWEQSRAAASGRSAVQVVERTVSVSAAPPAVIPPRQAAWVELLRELTTQLDHGLVYDRHLPAITAALDGAARAARWRTPSQRAMGPRRPWGDRGTTQG